MIVIGADTHKRTHAPAAVDGGTGQVRGGRQISADDGGHLAALRWARELDSERVWAIEDCRQVSRRLEQALLAAGERVVRVAPQMMGTSRRGEREPGKSDEIDALAVARAVVKDGVDRFSPHSRNCQICAGPRVTSAQEQAQRGLAAARASGHKGLEANAVCLDGWSRIALGDTAAGVAQMRSAWEMADAARHVPSAFMAAFHAGGALIHLKDPVTAEAALRAELERPRLQGAPHLRGLLHERLAHVALLAGRLDDASRLLERSGTPIQVLLGPAVRSWRAGEIGDVPVRDPSLGVCDLELELARLLRLAGRLDDARAIVASLVALTPDADERVHLLQVHAAAAETEAYGGRLDDARAQLASAQAVADKFEDLRGCATILARARAVTSAAAGDLAAADQHAHDALAAAQRYELPLDAVDMLLAQARWLTAAGDATAACEPRERAAQLLQRHGAAARWVELALSPADATGARR